MISLVAIYFLLEYYRNREGRDPTFGEILLLTLSFLILKSIVFAILGIE